MATTMRNHLTLKQIAAAIGVRETYAGQAFDPALRKVAAVFLRHPLEAIRLLTDEADRLRAEMERSEICKNHLERPSHSFPFQSNRPED